MTGWTGIDLLASQLAPPPTAHTRTPGSSHASGEALLCKLTSLARATPPRAHFRKFSSKIEY